MGRYVLPCWHMVVAQVLPVKMSDLIVKVKEKRDSTG